MRLLCLAALLLGYASTCLAQDPAPEPVVDSPQILQKVIAYRWVAVEKTRPVTLQQRYQTWELSPYEIELPQPGPQPADVILCEPQCVPVGQAASPAPVMSTRVSVPFTNVQVGPQVCPNGQCGLVQGASTNVDVRVGRRRGLFWRFRR